MPRRGALPCPITSPDYDDGDGGVAGADALGFPHQERDEVQLRAGARVPAGACQGGGLRGDRPRDDRGHQRPVAGVLRVRRYDVRYLKVKDSAEKFAVVQFGVCPFRWDPQELCFVAHPHNFYIFPRQELSFDDPSAYEFLCQTASVDFLAKYQFDFNMCIREENKKMSC